jgi:hypothetical protein
MGSEEEKYRPRMRITIKQMAPKKTVLPEMKARGFGKRGIGGKSESEGSRDESRI